MIDGETKKMLEKIGFKESDKSSNDSRLFFALGTDVMIIEHPDGTESYDIEAHSGRHPSMASMKAKLSKRTELLGKALRIIRRGSK
jgi:hypothetical protein